MEEKKRKIKKEVIKKINKLLREKFGTRFNAGNEHVTVDHNPANGKFVAHVKCPICGKKNIEVSISAIFHRSNVHLFREHLKDDK